MVDCIRLFGRPALCIRRIASCAFDPVRTATSPGTTTSCQWPSFLHNDPRTLTDRSALPSIGSGRRFAPRERNSFQRKTLTVMSEQSTSMCTNALEGALACFTVSSLCWLVWNESYDGTSGSPSCFLEESAAHRLTCQRFPR